MKAVRLESYPSGWLFVGWLACIVYFFWVPVREEFHLKNLRTQAGYASVPDLSLKELASRIESLDMASRLPGDLPEQFYTTSVESFLLMRVIERRRAVGGRDIELNRLERKWASIASRQTRLFSEYVVKFPQEAMREAAGRFADKPPYAPLPVFSVSVPRHAANCAWGIAYLRSVLLAPFLFYLILRRLGMGVMLEIPRILMYMWIWFIAVFFYPIWVDVKAQARRAKLWAAYAFSALVSFAPFGSVAKAQQGSGGGKKNEIVFVLQETARSQYLNYPGVRISKNAVAFTELRAHIGQWDAGIVGSLGLGKRDFLKHHPANEIDFYIGWRKRWAEHFETYLRASYFMNDFVAGGIDKATDDQWIIESEVSFPGVGPVAPYIAYRYFGAVGGESPHPGSFWKLGARRGQPFQFFGYETALALDGQVAFSDGALGRTGKDGGVIYGRVGVSWDFRLTKTLSLIPHILAQFAAQYGGVDDYTHDPYTFVYGLTLKRTF